MGGDSIVKPLELFGTFPPYSVYVPFFQISYYSLAIILVCFFLFHPSCSHPRGILCGIYTSCMESPVPAVCVKLSLVFWFVNNSYWRKIALSLVLRFFQIPYFSTDVFSPFCFNAEDVVNTFHGISVSYCISYVPLLFNQSHHFLPFTIAHYFSLPFTITKYYSFFLTFPLLFTIFHHFSPMSHHLPDIIKINSVNMIHNLYWL